MPEVNVFVSSTYEDLKGPRARVRELLSAMGLVDIAMETWPAKAHPPKEEVEDALGRSDIYVGIVAWKYGSRVAPAGMSYTEYEYELARRYRIPRLVFLTDPDAEWPVKFVDIGEDGQALRRFREEIEGEKQILWRHFRTDMDLVLQLSGSLCQLVRELDKVRKSDPEDRAILELLHRLNADLLARANQIETQEEDSRKDWFISEISRCNVGRRYIPRKGIREQVSGWLIAGESPCLFLVGPSGIGKTNFLIEFMRHVVSERSSLSQDAVVFLPLGVYQPACSLVANVEELVSGATRRERLISARTFEKLIRSGRVLLILDGLDEFARNHGEEKCSTLFRSLAEEIDPKRSRVILSCRDHIYRRLKGRDLLQRVQGVQAIRVPFLTPAEVAAAIQNRMGSDSPCVKAVRSNPTLIRFAQNPLLLEMMCRMSRESWKKLLRSQTMGRLYDLWFEEIIATSARPEDLFNDELIADTSVKVGRIAGLMLRGRSDVIGESKLAERGLDLDSLETLTRQPFGILIRQTREEWGFVHDSFREFALAKTLATELTSKDYDLLANTASFDYVAAETYHFLRDLVPTDEFLLEHIDEALNSAAVDEKSWNNIARNCFEAIGMICERSEDRFIEKGCRILCPELFPEHPPPDLATNNTKYNIVRCLERLHGSAPRPYCAHVMDRSWPKAPGWDCFGAAAVRGFHRRQPSPGWFPPLVYLWPTNASTDRRQRQVSECLLRLLERTASAPRQPDAVHLEINCTLALIRWLDQEHVPRLKELLRGSELTADSKGNLFLALLRFKEPSTFDDCTELFEGMTLCWACVSQSWVSQGFVFRNVTFQRHDESKLEGFLPSAFENCRYV